MSAKRRLAELDYEEATGLDLAWSVADWREAGASWRQIARHIAYATDGTVTVTHETLRTWFGELEATA